MINDDLIYRSALMKYINETHPYAGLPMAAHICTMELLTYAPSVDAVEVVRCKDCQWFDPNENIMPQSGTCGYHEMVKMFWDFCSRGEVEEEVQSE